MGAAVAKDPQESNPLVQTKKNSVDQKRGVVLDMGHAAVVPESGVQKVVKIKGG
jgi:hypothetical protein